MKRKETRATESGMMNATCCVKGLKQLRYRDRRRRKGYICRTMHFVSLSRLTAFLKATFANGATILPYTSSPRLVDHCITREDTFARGVVKHSPAPSPGR